MFYILNAFSINMFPVRQDRRMVFEPVSLEEAKSKVAKVIPAMGIGHSDTAYTAAVLLGLSQYAEGWSEIAAMRPDVKLGILDSALIVQYRGPRLPEGATELPEGASLEFWQVREDF